MATSNIASCHKRGTHAKQCSLFTQAKLLNCFRKLFWVHIAKKIEKNLAENSIPSAKTHFSSSTSPPSWFPNMSSTQRRNAIRGRSKSAFYMPYDAVRKIYVHRNSLTNMCILHVPAGVHLLERVWKCMNTGVLYALYVAYRTLGHLQCPAGSSGLSSPGVSFSSRILAAANKWICDCSLSWSQLISVASQIFRMPAGFRISESNQRIWCKTFSEQWN